jgi:alpha-beta hydrolase superfamily lysophospholipase
MTVTDQHSSLLSWREPEGLNPRGTVVVIPGRGERPGVYERFGRRISSDAYRVHVVANPVEDAALAEEQIRSLLAGPQPVVLAGSDTGALFAAGLVASGLLPEADALVLAGLPTVTAKPDTDAADGESAADGGQAQAAEAADSWDAELEARTACPAHRSRLAGPVLRRGALYEPVPDGWLDLANLKAVAVPVLGLHGAADTVSPLAAARERYAAAPHAELVSIADGRHDAFNDIMHRTAAATVALFLERLRLGADLPPIAVAEELYEQQ